MIKSEQDAEITVRELAAEWIARKSFHMGVFDKKTDEFVAGVNVDPINWDVPEFNIGYFVNKDHEGQGYVTEAVKAVMGFTFEYLKAHRVSVQCDDTNDRSRRVAESCGMVMEGHTREDKKNVDGKLSGTLYFGLLKREFEALYKNG